MSHVVAIAQARMGSTRLPGKILIPLGDRGPLAHLVGRLRAARRLDDVVIATTIETQDDAVAEAGRTLGVTVVRGSADDVLDRYRQAAAEARADVVVRVTADCPAFDPYVLDAMLATWTDDDDYVSNVAPRTYPRGLDAEIVARAALERAAAEAKERPDREHVTSYLYRTAPERFRRRAVVRAGADLSALRWTLDTQADADFFRALIAGYGSERFATDFAHEPLARFLAGRPEIAALNARVTQKPLDSGAPRADEEERHGQ